MSNKIDQTEKMVKVRINIPTLKPYFDVNKLAGEITSLHQQQTLQNILLPTEELEVPESIANEWCNEKHLLPRKGMYGVINSSQAGITPPQITNKDNPIELKSKIDSFHKDILKIAKVEISRASRI